ncbi:MAG: tail protein X [Proteobacteria bacterium]|nr:tail protein X [Pseudomonadota bacterium]
MRTAIAANGDTWDSIAYRYTGDEFQCDAIREANSYAYSDVVIFTGGEQVVIPDAAVVEPTIIRAPWED